MNRLKNKVAIVTGASQGMGAAHARMMVEEGAKVVLTDVNTDSGNALAEELGDKAIFIPHDVANLEDWEKVMTEAERAFGTVNVLVNNAAIIGEVAQTIELSVEEYQRVCLVNQTGVFLGMKSVLPRMSHERKGSIVNISSIAGIVAIYGAPNVAYVASKFAVRGMTKQVAVEYGAFNIRANCIHPGFIRTPMMAAATDEAGGEAVNQIPLRRLAEPSEVANLVVFLASDESAFITGTEQIIDGGMTAT